jgi:TP901 family phage tail tape measure protein
MTAIWNNFADGTKTLEYYADAMARLGADTAASTSEIANGLEKFAAIADVVGLSYETAMASVATVIDKTRQSADVVGTAFKTIFARVQGLSLDGVTDDGVSLNKYSKALEKVGVDVLTASGELRDMDDILNDLGSKWEGLGKETQVAVAQVVGGARQYNQILALMDNWADVQNNINKATSATGELNK